MTNNINENLHAAVIRGDLEQVRALIDAGANVNYRSIQHHDTALHYAPTPEIAYLLLQSKADVSIKDSYGQTPLCCAVKKANKLDVVRILLSFGSCVNVRMVRDITPLHYAPDVKLTELLLQNGAIVNAADNFGRTPLHSALIDGKGLEVVKILLSAGADINLKIGQFCNSFLHYADSVEIIREFLSRGIDVNILTERRQTPLHYAVKQLKKVSVVRELLNNGAHVNAVDLERNTALVYAVRSYWKDFDVIKELLEHGALINEVHFDYSLRRFCTILDSAINHDMDYAKLIIKIYLIRRYVDRKSTVDLDPDIPSTMLGHISGYIDDCLYEIRIMKGEKIGSHFTLYDIVINMDKSVRPLYLSYRTLENEVFIKYPIYHDVISSKIRPHLERGLLLDQFQGLQLYAMSNSEECNGCVKEYMSTLNSDCTRMIAEFLPDEDLRNLLTVLQFNHHSSFNLC